MKHGTELLLELLDWMTVFSPLSWIVVVLTIIVAFGVTLVSLGTDPRRLPME